MELLIRLVLLNQFNQPEIKGILLLGICYCYSTAMLVPYTTKIEETYRGHSVIKEMKDYLKQSKDNTISKKPFA